MREMTVTRRGFLLGSAAIAAATGLSVDTRPEYLTAQDVLQYGLSTEGYSQRDISRDVWVRDDIVTTIHKRRFTTPRLQKVMS